MNPSTEVRRWWATRLALALTGAGAAMFGATVWLTWNSRGVVGALVADAGREPDRRRGVPRGCSW